MRKSLLHIVLALAAALALAACGRAKVIPDNKLESIFKEIFISNAYVNSNVIMHKDSMDMYRPILEKYGYDVDDLVHTMANFSRRKSMRLSDVVDDAINSIEAEEKVMRAQVAVLDTVDVRAQRMFRRTVYEDSLIVARKISDTAALRIRIPVERGQYEVEYFYFIDSLDKNKNLKTTFVFRDSTGRGTGTNTNWMTSTKRQSYSTKLNAKKYDHTLEIVFGNYQPKKMTRPALEIDSFRVVYYPPVDVAIDSVNKVLVDYKLMIDGHEYDKVTADSSSLRIHPPRIAEQGSDNAER